MTKDKRGNRNKKKGEMARGIGGKECEKRATNMSRIGGEMEVKKGVKNCKGRAE